MNIEEIEKNIDVVEDCLSKIKNLVSDIKLCQNEVSKNILYAALKKYSSTLSEFKLD